MDKENKQPATAQLKFDIQDNQIEIVEAEELLPDFIAGNFDYDLDSELHPWIWADRVIFDDETREKFLSLPQSERPRFTVEAIDRFYDKNPEFRDFYTYTIWEQPETLLKHFKSLTLKDFEECEIRLAKVRFEYMQQKIKEAERELKENPLDKENITLSSSWPIISIKNNFTTSELCAFYYRKPPKIRKRKGGELHAILEAKRKNYSGFNVYRQGPMMNAYTSTNKAKGGTVDKVSGKWTYKGNNFTVELMKGNDLTGTAIQLFSFAVMLTSEEHCRSEAISFNLTDYMLERGIKDKGEARKQVKRDLKAITASHITYEGDKYDFNNEFGGLNFVDHYDFKNGNIVIVWTKAFLTLLQRYPIRPLHPEMFKLNTHRNPNALYFYNKIAEIKNIRVDKENQNEDIISVKTLLEAAATIPKYEDLKASGNYDFRRRIIDPFERDLDALDNIFTWEYCKTKGALLNEEELSNMDYSTFESLNVHIYWRAYPDQQKRIEKANERREAQAKLNDLKNKEKAKEAGKLEAKKGVSNEK